MRVMTGTAVNYGTSSIDQMITDVAHARCLTGGIVAVLAGGLLSLTPGHDDFKYAILYGIAVAVKAAYGVARIMGRSLGFE